MPPVSSGWVEAFDVETGRSRVISRKTLRTLGRSARMWQDDIQKIAKDADIDVLRLSLDERRLRKA
jgi:hypothetical protein